MIKYNIEYKLREENRLMQGLMADVFKYDEININWWNAAAVNRGII